MNKMNGGQRKPMRKNFDPQRGAARRRGLLWILLILWLAGEAIFSGLHARLPGAPVFAILVAVYFSVKMLGDLLCQLTGRSAHEWGYLDDYLINELVFGYVFFALPLSFAQAIAAVLFPTDSLPWRFAASALPAVLVWGILRRKKEYELAHAHKYGQRVRIKYNLPREGER